jgi:hypothetical protein
MQEQINHLLALQTLAVNATNNLEGSGSSGIEELQGP